MRSIRSGRLLVLMMIQGMVTIPHLFLLHSVSSRIEPQNSRVAPSETDDLTDSQGEKVVNADNNGNRYLKKVQF